MKGNFSNKGTNLPVITNFLHSILISQTVIKLGIKLDSHFQATSNKAITVNIELDMPQSFCRKNSRKEMPSKTDTITTTTSKCDISLTKKCQRKKS